MQFLFVINQHNIVVADIIRPRNLYKFVGAELVGCGDSGMNFLENLVLQTVRANFVCLLFGSPVGELDWRSQD